MKIGKPILFGTAVVPLVALLAMMLWHPAKPAGHEAVPQSPAPPDPVAKRLALLAEMAKSDPNYRWKIPLEFYGKVVDQHGEAVPNTKVEIHYTPDPNGEKWYELTAATDGTFAYGGVKGQYLYVKVGAPEGYGVVDSTCSADYNYAVPGEFNFHVPDPARPVIFKVWKYSGPEPMNHWIFRGKDLRPDGSIIWFDMKEGKIGGADLGVSEIDHLPGVVDEEWITFKISAGDGCGVIETEDEPMYVAPDAGYKKEIVHEFRWKSNQNVDARGCEFRFYFLGRDSKYSAVTAEIVPAITGKFPYNGSVVLSVKKNPSGSRNLEYVESLSIQDGKSGH